MAKQKKSLKKNGQEFQPKYQFWAEQDFWADPQVRSGMSKKQRHYYRALLQSAYYSATRPNLPFSDSELWIMADAENLDDWMGCREEIMAKFEAVEMIINKQEKNFVQVYHEFFLPNSAKNVSLLRHRVQREMDVRSITKPVPAVTYFDVIVADTENPLAWQVEKARWLTLIDERFPMLHPAPGESIDDFIHRMFLPFKPWRTWRSSKCEYGVGEDGDMDERVKWCQDCGDELRIDRRTTWKC